jgi:class 3 adenylate cyclase/tetratricopeptide (TPR) repeat protein
MAGRLDPEDWAEVMNEAFEYLIGPIYRYEGTVARLMGDGILAIFGAPIAHEDDPQRAVLAGLDILKDIQSFSAEIQREYGLDFGLRIGIHTGPVVVGEIGSDLAMEYTAMGDAANVAARMEQTAEPGSIQISESTYKLLAPLFQMKDLGDVMVKGKDEPIKTYRVIDIKEDPGKLRGIEGLDAPLIGRTHEMDILKNTLDDLQLGRGGIVTVLGDAGLGKSRLIEEFFLRWKDRFGEDGSWLSSRGISYETTQPYGLFRQLLQKMSGIGDLDTPAKAREKIRSFLAQIPGEQCEQTKCALESLLVINEASETSDLEGEAFQRELYTAFRNIWHFYAQDDPTVYVFDDLHWADAASIELLIHLLQLVDEIPVLFLCALRPYRQTPAWQVKIQAETNYPHRYQEIVLNPLPESESQSLIQALVQISDLPPNLQDLIFQKAEGNPFFVEEVIRSLFDQGIIRRGDNGTHHYTGKDIDGIIIPENLQALLTARIDRLTSEVRSTLQFASVIGRTFYHRILKWVSDIEGEIDTHLITLQRVDLIRETTRIPEIEYIFRHELTRDAAYKTILRRERKEFHLRVAEALESTFPERIDDLAPRLAHHFDQAGEYEKALMYYIKAGEIAAKLYANKEAIDHLTRAIKLMEFVDITPEDRISLYTLRGRTFEVMAQYDDALDNYQELETFGKEQRESEMELAAIIPQATLYSIPTGKIDFEQGSKLSARSLKLAEELQDLSSKAKALWNMLLLSYFSRGEANVEYGEEALKIAREHNSKEDLAYILHDLARAYASMNDFKKARTYLKESQELWRELGNLPMLADNLTMNAYEQLEAGNFERAISLGQEAREISESINNLWGQAYSSTMIGPAIIELGRISEGIESIIEAEQNAEEANFMGAKILSPSMLSWIYASYGDFTRAYKMIERAVKESEEMSLFLSHVNTGAAWLKFREGHTEEAMEILSRALAEESTNFPDVFLGSLLSNLRTEITIVRGEFEEALSLANRTIDTMNEAGRNLFLPDALHLKAKALLEVGMDDEGHSTLDEAKDLAERTNSRRSLLSILGTKLELEREQGNSEKIESILKQGKEIASFIAEHITDPELKDMFINLENLRSFFE